MPVQPATSVRSVYPVNFITLHSDISPWGGYTVLKSNVWPGIGKNNLPGGFGVTVTSLSIAPDSGLVRSPRNHGPYGSLEHLQTRVNVYCTRDPAVTTTTTFVRCFRSRKSWKYVKMTKTREDSGGFFFTKPLYRDVCYELGNNTSNTCCINIIISTKNVSRAAVVFGSPRRRWYV